MEKVVINAKKRDVLGKKVGALRREGKLPGVVYGNHIQSVAILMDYREVTRSIAGLTSSSIVVVNIDGEEHASLIREKQRDYLKNRWTHIDFQAVLLTEKIRAKIEVVLSGVAPAVKNYNGLVLQDKEFIEVEALPNDLPERIVVDISSLEKIGSLIRVSDLNINKNVTVFDAADETIVSVTGQMLEMEEEATSTAAEPEVVEKGKKEKPAE